MDHKSRCDIKGLKKMIDHLNISKDASLEDINSALEAAEKLQEKLKKMKEEKEMEVGLSRVELRFSDDLLENISSRDEKSSDEKIEGQMRWSKKELKLLKSPKELDDEKGRIEVNLALVVTLVAIIMILTTVATFNFKITSSIFLTSFIYLNLFMVCVIALFIPTYAARKRVKRVESFLKKNKVEHDQKKVIKKTLKDQVIRARIGLASQKRI